MTRWSYVVLALLLGIGTATARTWHVPGDAPTIQAGVDSAQAGDEVLVAPGTYREHDIEIRRAITIRSEGGAATAIIDGEEMGLVFDVADVADLCVIEGFTIRRGLNAGEAIPLAGGGLAIQRSWAVVRGCVIKECEAPGGGGVYVVDSDVIIDECRISDNRALGAGGVLASDDHGMTRLEVTRSTILRNVANWGSPGGILTTVATTIKDCVFAHNSETQDGPSAMMLLDEADVVGCTFVDNVSWSGGGATVGSQGVGVVRVERCIVAFNHGEGLSVGVPGSSVSCSNVFANSGGPGVWAEDGGGNFFADPFFCDPEGDDYTLLDESPCLPGHHPDGADCGLIGALGVGCGVTPLLDTTWGRIKGRYR